MCAISLLLLDTALTKEHPEVNSTAAFLGAALQESLGYQTVNSEVSQLEDVRSGTGPRRQPTSKSKLLGLVRVASPYLGPTSSKRLSDPAIRLDEHFNRSSPRANRLFKNAHSRR
jgi:hypothetical protein